MRLKADEAKISFVDIYSLDWKALEISCAENRSRSHRTAAINGFAIEMTNIKIMFIAELGEFV